MGEKASPFASGIWTPATKEVDAECPVESGRIPPELSGCFLRIGPNPKGEVGPNYHFFMGDGMVHRVELKGGRATYRNRWVRTAKWLTGKDRGGAERRGLANTAMVYHADRLLCLEEGATPYEISLPDLDTKGHFDFGGALRHKFTAHPKVCSQTGELIFFGYGAHAVEGSPKDAVHISVASPEGKLLRSVPVQFRRTVMTHDCAITRNYSILMDFPLWSMSEPIDPKNPSRFGVLPRHATSPDQVRWFEAPGQYAYHTVNAWERDDGRSIELLMVSDPNFGFTRRAKLHMHRWVFDLESGATVVDEDICDVQCEFPVINPKLMGVPCRYTWAARLCRLPTPIASDAVFKLDLKTGKVTVHEYGGEWMGGEPAFVPREGGEEDEGHLLVITIHPTERRSQLRIIDSMHMTEVARLALPTWVPAGFHSEWVARELYAKLAPKL
eukprot:Hpha_TRINITY_DN15401_c2_g10::TRINITY_DN15401_c2_g10_i1::g.174532::m.174532/K11159/K11159; carotenoid cleavage dioxygenase